MNENLLDHEQRTDEWYQARSGKFTGSRFIDVLTKPNKSYFNLLDQIVAERITGEYYDTGLDSKSLRWGREHEQDAISAYQFDTGNEVITSGFATHKILNFAGASPDGLVGIDGGVEIKCPKDPKIHLRRFEDGMIESEFMPQVQGCIWVLEREWWDWLSYDPRMPIHLQMYRQRVWRDDAYIVNLERSILLAEGEVRTRLESFTPGRIEKILEQRLNKQGESHE